MNRKNYLESLQNRRKAADQWDGMEKHISDVNKAYVKHEQKVYRNQQKDYKQELIDKEVERERRYRKEQKYRQREANEIRREHLDYHQNVRKVRAEQRRLKNFVLDNNIQKSMMQKEIVRKKQIQKIKYEQQEDMVRQKQIRDDYLVQLQAKKELRDSRLEDIRRARMLKRQKMQADKRFSQQVLQQNQAYARNERNQQRNYRDFYRKTMLDEQKRQVSHQQFFQQNKGILVHKGKDPQKSRKILDYQLDNHKLDSSRRRSQTSLRNHHVKSPGIFHNKRTMAYSNLTQLDLQEQQLTKDIYKRTLDAQRQLNQEMRIKKRKLDQQTYSLNRKDIENFKKGKKQINALIPGINPGVLQNPNLHKEQKFMASPALGNGKYIQSSSIQPSRKYNRAGSMEIRKYRIKRKLNDDIFINDPFKPRVKHFIKNRTKGYQSVMRSRKGGPGDLVGIEAYSHNPITNPMEKNMQNPYIKRELMRARNAEKQQRSLEASRMKFYGEKALG